MRLSFLNERIRNLLNAFVWRDHCYSGATRYDESQAARLLRRFKQIIVVANEFLCVVENEIQKRVVTFENAGG